MNLIINWSAPSPLPSCQYVVNYRRNQDPLYNTINTSGTTSGSTLSIYAAVPACYEGTIVSDCCGENISDPGYFGVNAYSSISVVVTVRPQPLAFIATVTSIYPNPYNTLITGTYNASTSGATNLPFTITYPAGTTSAIIVLSQTPASAAVTTSNLSVNSVSPLFDNGGNLQQFDSVNTPPYFAFYTSNVPTWSGSPITLPSFVLRQFNVTSQDSSGNPLAGDLIISWIYDSLYNSGVSPYDRVIFSVYDATMALVGTGTNFNTHIGLNQTTISINKVVSPISISTLYSMITTWGNGTISATKTFYLPSF